jgi:hypothetical protein
MYIYIYIYVYINMCIYTSLNEQLPYTPHRADIKPVYIYIYIYEYIYSIYIYTYIYIYIRPVIVMMTMFG